MAKTVTYCDADVHLILGRMHALLVFIPEGICFSESWMSVLDAGLTVRRRRSLSQFTQEGAQQVADEVPSCPYRNQWDSSLSIPLGFFRVYSGFLRPGGNGSQR